MAKTKRMINCEFVNVSSFKLNISNKAKLLYFFLMANSDDKGFVGNADEIVILLNTNDSIFHNEASMDLIKSDYSSALNELLNKGLLFQFTDNHSNNIYLIKHWYIHNSIPEGRITDSVYEKYLSKVFINSDKEYELYKTTDKQVSSKCNTADKQVSAQIKLNEIKENKNNTTDICSTNVREDIKSNITNDNILSIPKDNQWTAEQISLATDLYLRNQKGESLNKNELAFMNAYKNSIKHD